MELNKRDSPSFGPQHYESRDRDARRTSHPLAQSSTLRQLQADDTDLVQHAESNYIKPFRGLPAEIRLMIWRFALEEPLRASIRDLGDDSEYKMHSPTFYNLLRVNHAVNKEVLETAQKRLIFDFHTMRPSLIEEFDYILPERARALMKTVRLCEDEFGHGKTYHENSIIAECDKHQLRKQNFLRIRSCDSIRALIELLEPSQFDLVISGTAWRQDVEEAKWNNIGEDENCNIRMPSSRPLRPPPLPLSPGTSTVLVQALSEGTLKLVRIELSDASGDQQLLLSPGLFAGRQPHEEFLRVSSALLRGISSEVTWERARPNGLFNGVCRLTRQDA